MRLRELQANWDEFGRRDAMWAILTVPGKEGGRWTVEEFLQTGNAEIDDLLQYLASLHLSINRCRALDFGCGLGRLSQGLARYFDEVVGVDIAPSMIQQARLLNRHGTRCRYVLNEGTGLSGLGTRPFDLIYTSLVLQHVGPRYAKRYLRELMRLLAPAGVLVFQLPSERRIMAPQAAEVQATAEPAPGKSLKRRLRAVIPAGAVRWYWGRAWYWTHSPGAARWKHLLLGPGRAPGEGPRMEMHAVPRRSVERLLQRCGGRVVDVVENDYAGPAWVSLRYCVTK